MSISHTAYPSQEVTLSQATHAWRKLLSGYTAEEREIIHHRPVVLSIDNMKHNDSWGDRLGPKDELHTRIYAINVNGISVDRRGGTFDDICRTVKEVQADELCLQEHNLETTKTGVEKYVIRCSEPTLETKSDRYSNYADYFCCGV